MVLNLLLLEATAMLYLYGYQVDYIRSNSKLDNANGMRSPFLWPPIFPVLAVRMSSTVPATPIPAFFSGQCSLRTGLSRDCSGIYGRTILLLNPFKVLTS